MGDLELYLIYQYGDQWEDEWSRLQGSDVAKLLTVVSREVMDQALLGWTYPLVKALGIPPEGALRKFSGPLCYRRSICPYHQKKSCIPTHPKMPWCFESEALEDPDARRLGSELLRLWRQEVYILVVVHVIE